MIGGATLTGGFADPSFQSQATFRRILDAFARPGTVIGIPLQVAAPHPLHGATAALLATLADESTPVFLAANAAAGPVPAWMTFHTGAQLTRSAGEAAFAVIIDAGAPLDLSAFATGTQNYPDRSTTVIVQIDGFAAGDLLHLEGPGIDGAMTVRAHPLPPNFAAALTANRALFPRGVDLILAAPAAILAMPRSTRVASAEEV